MSKTGRFYAKLVRFFACNRGKIKTKLLFHFRKEGFIENTGGTSLPFTDVADGAWYYDAVVYAYDKGLMTGTSATEFAPDVTMTRGMIASVLYRLEGNPAMSDGNLGYPYEDVEGDD